MLQLMYIVIPMIVTVALLIRAEFQENRKQIYIFKPISTLLVILIAALSFFHPQHQLIYSIGIVIGLLLCFGGDIALMFPNNAKAFTLGLRLFLLGHVAYTIAFILLTSWTSLDIISAVVLLLIGIFLYGKFKPNLGAMKIPVILYMIVISVMVNRAGATLASEAFTGHHAMMILGGAILFYISDVILASNRFWKPWKYNRISLAFYYSGQLLLALATHYFNVFFE